MANKIIASGISIGDVFIRQTGPGKKKIKMSIPANSHIHLLGNYRIKEYS